MQTDLIAKKNAEKVILPRTIPRFPQDSAAIHHVVEAQVRQRPDAGAVVCNGEKLSYRELNERANQVAHALKNFGVGPESLVGVLMNRSVRTVVAILGILKAGGCYVPIDLAYPKERIQFILTDSQAAALITESEHLELSTGFNGKTLFLDAGFES